jgi:hypothetical protein
MTKFTGACLAALLLTSCTNPEADNWKRRWDEDTKLLYAELKLEARKLADAGNEIVRLQNENAALRSELMESKKAATSAP